MRWAIVVFIAAGACADAAPPVRNGPPVPGSRAPNAASAPAAASAPERASERPFVGVIAAAESADVVPRFGGVLAAVHVRPGDRVSAGQTVAVLDPAPLAEALRAAQAAAGGAAAELRKARVDVEDARRKLELETRATGSGISPAAALDEARLAVKRARAAEQSAAQEAVVLGSRAKTARSDLAQTRLAAPFEGIVALRFRDAGANVEPGTPIVKIVKQGELRLRFAVPPDLARTLRPGTPVTAVVDTVAPPVAATVQLVSPALDPASELILVEAALAVPAAVAADLRPGLAAEVSRAPAER